jgi:hypothetical protein
MRTIVRSGHVGSPAPVGWFVFQKRIARSCSFSTETAPAADLLWTVRRRPNSSSIPQPTSFSDKNLAQRLIGRSTVEELVI